MLTRRERLRRAAILCCSCARNLAYYRAGWQDGKPLFDPTRLQRTINSNFIDMAVLEWCKLFHSREKHSWRSIVTQPQIFEHSLMQATGLDDAALQEFVARTRAYRDKFVAHLDFDPVAYVPKLDVPKATATFYYSYLLAHEDEGDTFDDGPSDLAQYFDDCAREAKQALYGTMS